MFTSKVTIRKGDSFELISYGNGMAYELRRDDGESIVLQGDDAIEFEKEYLALERARPTDSVDSILDELWSWYG